MRFLCLHGAGTSSKIFESQTAALRHQVGGNHTYEFVEGVVPCAMNAAIKNIATEADRHFGYYEPHDSASFAKALQDLKTYVAEEGPFDGIVAFSQGTSIAAAFILDQQRQVSTRTPARRTAPVACAVFFAGRLPYMDAGYLPKAAGDGGEVMDLPTTHIWGSSDHIEPGQHEALSELCRRDGRQVLVHGGGHEVPGARDKDALADSANLIRRMLVAVANGGRSAQGAADPPADQGL